MISLTDPVQPTSSRKVSNAADAKLKRATAEFETLLLTSWLEQMRQSYSMDDQQQTMAGGENMTALATQAVASAISVRGGIGIGQMMYDRLRSQ